MSDDSESIKLSAHDLMQNWVSDLEGPQKFKEYKDFDGERERKGGRGKGGGRGFGGGGGGGARFGDDRRGGSGGGGGGAGRGQGASQNRGGGKDFGGRSKGGQGGGQRGQGGGGKPWERGGGGRQGDRRNYGPPADPVPQFSVAVEPTQETVEALAKHIRSTGRAYSMFDVARNVMASRERYQVAFQAAGPKAAAKSKSKAKKKTVAADQAATPTAVEAAPVQAQPQVPAKPKPAAERPMLTRCKIDGSLWLTREEAIRHFLSSEDLLKEFYTVEEVTVDAPKGNFSAIAVCGMSGTLLGPPNHHEYQTNVAKLHRERFSNLSLERFKQRIEMKRDEETIEAWKASVSVTRQFKVKPPEPKVAPVEKAKAEEPGSAKDEVVEKADAEVVAAEAPAEKEAASVDEASTPEAAVDAAVPENAADAVVEEAPAVDADAPAEGAAAAEAGNDDAAEAAPEAEAAEPAEEAEPEVVLKNDRELEQHFRDQFAKRVLRPVGGGIVSGAVPGRNLSPGLLEKLKIETDNMRRGFPLPLIQTLCRRLEKLGVKFFKRDRKALFASSARPRAIREESGMTDRIRSIVEYVRAYPKVKVPKLLESLIEGFIAPRNEEEMSGHKPTEEELGYLRDIRWLTSEGYLIEYSNGELMLGHDEAPRGGPSQQGGGGKPAGTGKPAAPAAKAKGQAKAAAPASKPAKGEPKPEAAKAKQEPEVQEEKAVVADLPSEAPAPTPAPVSEADATPAPEPEKDPASQPPSGEVNSAVAEADTPPTTPKKEPEQQA